MSAKSTVVASAGKVASQHGSKNFCVLQRPADKLQERADRTLANALRNLLLLCHSVTSHAAVDAHVTIITVVRVAIHAGASATYYFSVRRATMQ
jgi:hypothetical protein